MTEGPGLPDRVPLIRGARGIRTPDLFIANEARYHLRHSPEARTGYHLGDVPRTSRP